jgi:hypothetical protein
MPPQAAPPPPPRLAILCRWLPTPFAPPDVENLRDGAQRLRRQDPELLHRERLLGAASEGGGGTRPSCHEVGKGGSHGGRPPPSPRRAGRFALCCHPHRLGARHGSAADAEERADAELEEQQRAQG